MGHEHGQKEATGILEFLSILSLDFCFVSEDGTMEHALGGLGASAHTGFHLPASERCGVRLLLSCSPLGTTADLPYCGVLSVGARVLG